jgi:flavin reductase (DIM6/NTAB) family NADH-FMN oxidoreductase RutF
MISFGHDDIARLEKRFRTTFINSLGGFKSANLIGTIGEDGLENLAIFSSVIHIGADPALLGFVIRPISSERHTYENIISTKVFTVNAITGRMTERAHATSARYQRDVSEFDACGIAKEYIGNFRAPFVEECPLKIGCTICEDVYVTANETRLIIGRIDHVHLYDTLLGEDGYVDLSLASISTISSLDAYHSTNHPVRYAYAKPNTPTKQIN